jgi:hypothetical protein
MTESYEHRIDHTELAVMSFKCPDCQAESTLDWKNEKQRHRLIELSNGAKLHCSFCSHPFDEHLNQAFGSFRDFMDRLKASGHTLTFHIPRRA